MQCLDWSADPIGRRPRLASTHCQGVVRHGCARISPLSFRGDLRSHVLGDSRLIRVETSCRRPHRAAAEKAPQGDSDPDRLPASQLEEVNLATPYVPPWPTRLHTTDCPHETLSRAIAPIHSIAMAPKRHRLQPSCRRHPSQTRHTWRTCLPSTRLAAHPRLLACAVAVLARLCQGIVTALL